ncbi:MAG: branched-chain amino acid ABC transporter permease [Candidatus Dormibacteraeota bacterium]|nr:branched-chain amino acid ABC transporter permease [Candidatus Dormibacteraeota bacterium]
MSPRTARLRLAGGVGAVVIVVATMPIWLPATNFLTLTDGVLAGIYTLLGLSLVLLIGYTGQLALTVNVTYGLGAYTTAILTVDDKLNPWLTILIGVAINVAFALVLALPLLRLQGHFLAVATLGVALIGFTVFQAAPITGGPNGIDGVTPLSIGSLQISSDTAFAYLAWIVALLALIGCRNLISGRLGRAMQAIKGSEAAASSVGIRPFRVKMMVFVLAAVLSSVAGSLYATYTGFVSPDAFSVSFTITILVMVVVGGLRSVWGVPFGVFAILALNAALQTYGPSLIPAGGTDIPIVGYGVVLIVFLMFLPGGLASAAQRLWRSATGSGGPRRSMPEIGGAVSEESS